MARQALGLGEHGEIDAIPQKRDADGKWKRAAHHRSADRWRARVWFRGYDGVVREISRFGKTKSLAVAGVEDALAEQESLGSAGMSPSMLVPDAVDYWLKEIRRTDSKFAASTIDDYERAAKNHVKGEQSMVRGLTLKQVNDPQRLRLFLQDVADRRGTGAAKMARAVVAGVLWMAVENGLFATNAIKMVKPIQSQKPKQRKRPVEPDLDRAYTREERDAVIAYADKLACQESVNPRTTRKWEATADLMAFMAGTAARIGEARTARWEHLDLETGWVQIHGTKTGGSKRAVKMPEWLLIRMRTRAERTGTEELVFPSPHQLDNPALEWDQSNCNKAVRHVLDGAGMLWAVPHTFRRTVASMLEAAGWKWSDIADLLGHADPSMTAKNYLDRDFMARGDSRSAEIL